MSQTPSSLNSIPYLFDRPGEPLFLGKENLSFDVPTDYLIDRYKPLASSIQTRFPNKANVVPVQNVAIPDISLPLSLERRANFSIFNPYHRRCAVRLIEVLMGMPNVDQFLSACVYCRERINPFMFVYAASVAVLHRTDTRSVQIPAHVETFPELYLDGSVFRRAREEATVVPTGSRVPLELPMNYTASDLDPEHRVAYWREDVGINLHHWHWHLVYPFDGPLNIVRKDRRGELFYYMHEQIMARYNMERLCNELGRTRRLLWWRDPIPEAYYPKLDSLVASRVWPARQPNTIPSDLRRESDQLSVDIQDLERWQDRIFDAIHRGTVNNGTQDVRLTEADGIDVLGNLIESSILSVNTTLYGDYHNMGHNLLSYVHDPNNQYLESFAPMGDPTTAMRDPVFYAFHATVNDMFQEFKSTLPPYTEGQLTYSGIQVTGIEVAAEGIRTNEFQTFWQQNDIDLSRGLDFTPRGPLFARLTHLQHAPFVYRIRVENSGAQRSGTVRIFISPKFDERGIPFLYRDQRTLFVELDKFTAPLRSGSSILERRSDESSVTIPFEQTFRSIPNIDLSAQTTALEGFNYCGCGWPQHMLIAKGNAEGFPCELFVMITNAQDDQVAQDNATAGAGCDDAQSYCGLLNSRYPDRKPMGYPFDRPPRGNVNTLRQFLTPNMFVIDTRIRYNNRIVASASTSGVTRPGGVQQPGQPTPAPGSRPTPTPTQQPTRPGGRPGGRPRN